MSADGSVMRLPDSQRLRWLRMLTDVRALISTLEDGGFATGATRAIHAIDEMLAEVRSADDDRIRPAVARIFAPSLKGHWRIHSDEAARAFLDLQQAIEEPVRVN